MNFEGFPHSDSRGSRLISSSPRLFAAFHVLRRLLVPRHPPLALCSFTYFLADKFDRFDKLDKFISVIYKPLSSYPTHLLIILILLLFGFH